MGEVTLLRFLILFIASTMFAVRASDIVSDTKCVIHHCADATETLKWASMEVQSLVLSATDERLALCECPLVNDRARVLSCALQAVPGGNGSEQIGWRAS